MLMLVYYVGPIAMAARFNGFKGLKLQCVKSSPTFMSIIGQVSRRDFGLWQSERWNFGKALASCVGQPESQEIRVS